MYFNLYQLKYYTLFSVTNQWRILIMHYYYYLFLFLIIIFLGSGGYYMAECNQFRRWGRLLYIYAKCSSDAPLPPPLGLPLGMTI